MVPHKMHMQQSLTALASLSTTASCICVSDECKNRIMKDWMNLNKNELMLW